VGDRGVAALRSQGRLELTPDQWLARVQADFPYQEGRVYLQSAGAGLAFPGAAAAAGQYYVDTAALGCDAQPLWHRPRDSAKERVARLLDVPLEDVGFFRNTSEIINLVANSVPWRRGDEVIFLADEYPCNVLPWGRAEEAGATVIGVDPGDPRQRQRRLLEALSDRTRVMSVSHVHPWTGVRVDLTALGRACRDAGALLVVDGIQALGATPADLSYVDVYGAGVFKWLMSGFGTAVGVFRERARSMLTPAFRSYGNPAPSTSFQYAAPNIPGLYVLDATLAYLEELGWERIYDRVHALAAHVLEALDDRGIAAITPRDAHAGIVSIGVDDSAAVAAELMRRGVSVSDRMGRIIASPHFYNTTEHIDRFADALLAVRAARSDSV
jgi:cysteine desulfurase / selenocysteine lyase